MNNVSEVVILLDSVDKVKNFISITANFDVEMDLISGRYVISAKSIVGILSMGLSKPLILKIHDEGKEAENIIDAVREYMVV